MDKAYEKVLERMSLRHPQRECLKKFDRIFKELPNSLEETPQAELLQVFREAHPEWNYDSGYPEMTCALATGVGKTRLMGAFMAYLHKAQASSNFLILTPRLTIKDKIVRETQASHSKYIFVDPSLVEQPMIYHSGNFEQFNPKRMLMHGPTIWVLTPQAMTGAAEEETRRFKRVSEYIGKSPKSYLEDLDDLIVFFDESHHMGRAKGDDTPAWTKAVRDLGPRMLFAMSASPKEGADILHEYSLPDCLRDGLYTKAVRIISQERPENIDDWEWDKVTLRYTLDRLSVKEKSVNGYESGEDDSNDDVKPVALVSAKDQDHAEKVSRWLKDRIGDESVLLVHSNMKEKEYMPNLLSVEEPSNDVRVIVNVFKLTEGWDVDNVYVISPLRAMATVRGVIQTMGRGLRLPYGDRVGVEEVDTLDVLCFGKQTMNEIADRVIEEGFGSREAQERYIDVTDRDSQEDSEEEVTFQMQPRINIEMDLPKVDWKRPRVDLEGFSLPVDRSKEPMAINLSDTDTVQRLESERGERGFSWEAFLTTVADLAIQKRKLIGGVTDRQKIKNAVSKYLLEKGHEEGDLVQIDPEYVARKCVEAVDNLLRDITPEYEKIEGKNSSITFDPFEIQVPDVFDGLPIGLPKAKEWKKQYKRQPIEGWSRCAYEAVPFDVEPEFLTARIIDSSPDVEWWVRNLRKIFYLHTPVGSHSPDFLFLMKLDGQKNVLMELKGEQLWGRDTNAYAKAKATEAWCEAMNELDEEEWDYWLILESDAREARNLQDLRQLAEDWKKIQK